jgi:hypothetical protein
LVDVLGGIRSFFEDLGRRQNQIKAIFQLIVTFFKDVANLIGSIFSQGDVAQLAVNFVKAGTTAAIDAFIAVLPTLLRTMEVVGTQLAAALIRAFIGESTLQLGQAIQGTGPGATLARLAAKTAGIDVDTLDQQVKGINSLRQEIAALKRETEVIGPGQFAISTGAIVDRDELEPEIQKLEEELSRRMKVLGGKVSTVASDAAVEALKEEAAEIPDKLGVVLGNALETLGEGLSTEAQELGATIAENWAKGLEAVSRGAKQDVANQWIKVIGDAGNLAVKKAKEVGQAILGALGLARDAEGDGGEAGPTEGFGQGAFGTIGEELDSLNQGFRTFLDNFNTFASLGASLGSALANGVSGLVDVFFQADASFKQFAANFLTLIGKMIIQMTILRALAAFFFAIGGASASSASQAATPTAGGPAAGTNIPGVGINKGGILGRFGVQRYNTGVPFVPGTRGANVDSVPSLLTVGEGVIQRPSVDYYGKRAISAINARLVPRNALQALTGAGAAPRGAVGGGLRLGGIAGSTATPTVPGFGGGVMPIMPTDRVTTEQLAGGAMKTALMRLMRDDPSGFKRALGVQDRQVR